MVVIGFDETINVRLRKYEKEEITKIVESNGNLFENESHFVRSAVLSFIRNWKKEHDEVLKNERKKSNECERVPSSWLNKSEENRERFF